MSPKQIRNQIVRRVLTDDGLDPRVFKAFDIDPSEEAEGEAPSAYPELGPVDEEDEIYQGVVPFEIQVSVLGRTHTFDCRAVYNAALTDDGSLIAMVDDVLGECEVEYQMLSWSPRWSDLLENGPARRPRPHWEAFEPGKLFHWELHELVKAMVERDARRQQESDT